MTFTPPAPLIRSAAMLPPPARVIKLPGEVWLSAIDPKPGLDSTSNTRAASRISEPVFWDPFAWRNRTFKLAYGTTSEYGRYAKSLTGSPRWG